EFEAQLVAARGVVPRPDGTGFTIPVVVERFEVECSPVRRDRGLKGTGGRSEDDLDQPSEQFLQ
ncbi:MAG TPA: hypothetical protein VFS09_09520, partial [Candidatus Eisenbacteria bacterium]|nr:hypothetical protein [Candidatus Eisenbacteria bacterium]